MKTQSSSAIEAELKNSLEILLKPIIHSTETKHSKLFVSSLSIVKKFVTYNLIKQNHTVSIIQILKDILDNTTEEFIQIKVLETLLPMVNPQTIHLTESLVNNVLTMCLKIFSFKNPVFKNPVSALFKQLMITTFGFLDSFMRPVIDKKVKQRQDWILQKQEEKKNKKINELHIPLNNELDLDKNYVDLNVIQEDKVHKMQREEIVETSEQKIVKEKVEEMIEDLHDHNSNQQGEEDIPNEVRPSDIDLSEFTSFEVYGTSLSIFKSLVQVSDGKKKEWISPNTYSKCLALELLSGVICQSGNLFKYLPEFMDVIKNDLYKIIKKNFEVTNDYIMGLKLARVSIQIVENLNTCYDLILHLLKYAEIPAMSWQKLIGLECLASLCQNNYVLFNLFSKKIEKNDVEKALVYDEIISTLTKVSYAAVTTKSNDATKKKEDKKENLKTQKFIEMSTILTETDIVIPNVNSYNIFKLLVECYSNYKDSIIVILELHGLKLGQLQSEFRDHQLVAKQMLNHNFEIIKNAMTALLINSTDDNMTQTYLILYQSYINIYGSMSLPNARDSYLNDLCKLAIPNNLENSFEMKEKNLLITKSLFNIAHCVNILDYNSWLLLVETMQKIYLMLINSNHHMLKPNEEFEIDVIIKNLESNIKKYNPDFEKEEKSVLRSPVRQPEDRKSLLDSEREVMPEESISSGATTNRDEKKENGYITSTQTNGQNNHPEKKKGLFSMFKSALGFSKSKNDPIPTTSTIKKENKEENMDLLILSNAIDTIFISSALYEDNTIRDIVKSLFDSSKLLLENASTTNINETLNTYIHFNLTKLLEISVINIKRIHFFWDLVVSMVTFICTKNLTHISRFSLDVLTIIDLFIIVQYKPIDFNSDWTSENWQKTIIEPFAKIASLSVSQNVNLNIIYNLSKVLQNSGQYLTTAGWTTFISVCQALVSRSEEILCDNTFKLLEQIINEYADYLTAFNILPLLEIIEVFSIYKRNHNISYSAITMFWSAATVTEKFQKLSALEQEDLQVSQHFKNLTQIQKEFYTKVYKSNKEREDFFNNLWKDFFFKMVNICSDYRFDVRKSTISIFADIFVAKNSLISNEVSLIIIKEFFLGVLEKSYTIFEEKLKLNRSKKNVTNEEGNQLKTPKFSDNVGDIKILEFKVDQLKLPERKQKFDVETVSKLTSGGNSDEKEWEDTTILLIQALGKTLKSFLFLNYQKIKEFEYYKENLLNFTINMLVRIMRVTTPEIASSVLKALQEIYYSNLELFLAYFEEIWKVYDELGRFITTEFFLSSLCTMATSSKMVYNVLEILREIFLKESNIMKKSDLLEDKNLNNLLSFIFNLIKSSKNSEGIQSITNPQRLLGDEKQIFEFVEKISKILVSESAWKIYCSFLSSYLIFDVNEPHSEAHLRKSLELFENFFGGGNIHLESNFIREYLPHLIQDVKEIACLRNKNEIVSVLIKNNKTQMQLWHIASFQLIKILSYILCGRNKNREDYNTSSNNYLSNYNSEVDALSIEKNSEQEVCFNPIWEATINCFESVFKQSEGGYKGITRTFLEELLKSCQEMEIQIINFIVNGLLPNSLKIPKEMQIKLLTLLDTGSNFDYNILNLSSQSSSSSSNISKVCISNLFELCKFKSEESLKKGIFK